MKHERHISLTGQSNFRDLGGYRTGDGRSLKWDQVYRSGRLVKLTDEDISQLEQLGVPWETVREDYLLSNQYRHDEVNKRLALLRQMAAEKQSISPDQVDMTNMEAFLIQDGSYIDASNDEILTEYDSVAEYIQDGLSLSQQEIFQLQESLLSA